jgi:DNA repair photolyase
VSAAPQIISASRRTDIPAFYLPWFMGRVRAGMARCLHPFTGEVLEISLRREHVHSIVFWTKNGRPLLEQLEELDDLGYPFCCHFTITGIAPELEPQVPAWDDAVDSFQQLSRRMGPERIWWRFDPILLTADLDVAYYVERFKILAAALQGYTTRCFFSFADFYGKVRRRLTQEAIPAVEPNATDKQLLAQELARIAAACGMALLSCCNDEVVGPTVGKAHCIDAALLAGLFPERALQRRSRPTRKQCGCSASRDIGMYDTCPHLCIYCYANQNGPRVRARHQRHDPQADMLIPLEERCQARQGPGPHEDGASRS